METFLSSLSILAITAATWVAYAHPREYTVFVFVPVLSVILVSQAAFIGYSVGIDHSALALRTRVDIPFSVRDEISKAIEANRPSGYWLLAANMASLYLALLAYLEKMGLVKSPDK